MPRLAGGTCPYGRTALASSPAVHMQSLGGSPSRQHSGSNLWECPGVSSAEGKPRPSVPGSRLCRRQASPTSCSWPSFCCHCRAWTVPPQHPSEQAFPFLSPGTPPSSGSQTGVTPGSWKGNLITRRLLPRTASVLEVTRDLVSAAPCGC